MRRSCGKRPLIALILAYKAFLSSPAVVNISSAFENSGSALDQFFSQAKRSASANISAACMRVAFQILTDSYAWAYPVMAVSAWIEVIGLSIWAVDLWTA